MAAKTNKQMKGTPEVGPNGVLPKSQRGQKPAKGAVGVVQNKHEKRGRNWLRLFVSGVLVTDMVWMMFGIYSAGWSATMTTNAMWATGVTHVAAIGVVEYLLHKLE